VSKIIVASTPKTFPQEADRNLCRAQSSVDRQSQTLQEIRPGEIKPKEPTEAAINPEIVPEGDKVQGEFPAEASPSPFGLHEEFKSLLDLDNDPLVEPGSGPTQKWLHQISQIRRELSRHQILKPKPI
jgi:hypothetical protein